MNILLNVETWVTQYFGVDNDSYAAGYHEGMDFVPVDRENWVLFAPTGGKIMWAGWGDTYGWNIILYDERSGLSFRFCHLDAMGVKEGAIVKKGDPIGVGGNTGNSEARHFHVNCVPMLMKSPGVYEYGTKAFAGNGFGGRVDPLPVFRQLGVWI